MSLVTFGSEPEQKPEWTTREACGNCRFFQVMGEDRGDAYGNCRRYPPNIHNGSSFPSVKDLKWCGEWQALPKIHTNSP
jgi:hypothetical protein